MRVEDRVRTIEVYTHDRYVVGDPVTPMDEQEAARYLDAYYASTGHEQDPSCGYAGILWFEISFRPDEDADTCLERARFWLERAQALSESPWPAIEERLQDVRDMQDA